MQQERNDHADHQQLDALLQSERGDPPLETGDRIGDDVMAKLFTRLVRLQGSGRCEEFRHFR